MRCADIEHLLPDVASGLPELPAGVLAHVAACPSCREAVEDFRLMLASDRRTMERDSARLDGLLFRISGRLERRNSGPGVPGPALGAGLAAAFCLLLAMLLPAAFDGRLADAWNAADPKTIDGLLGGMGEDEVIALGSTNGGGLASALETGASGELIPEWLSIEMLSEETRASLADEAGAEYLIAALSAEEFAHLTTELENP